MPQWERVSRREVRFPRLGLFQSLCVRPGGRTFHLRAHLRNLGAIRQPVPRTNRLGGSPLKDPRFGHIRGRPLRLIGRGKARPRRLVGRIKERHLRRIDQFLDLNLGHPEARALLSLQAGRSLARSRRVLATNIGSLPGRLIAPAGQSRRSPVRPIRRSRFSVRPQLSMPNTAVESRT